MKLIALMSGGIDSPVAAYIMSQHQAEIILLHMDNRPYADDRALERVRLLTDRLRAETGQEMPLWMAPHGPSQQRIAETCDQHYQCVMCKRTMQRTARELAKRLGAAGIVMGDSLGQVASQTLANIRSENIGLDFPVVRPLIGWDKLEIEAVARRIGTYELSIRPATGCTIVPAKPVTEAEPEKIALFNQTCDPDALAVAAAAAAVRLS